MKKSKRMKRAAARAPNWIRQIAASKGHGSKGRKPRFKHEWKKPTLGAASGVRILVKDGIVVGEK